MRARYTQSVLNGALCRTRTSDRLASSRHAVGSLRLIGPIPFPLLNYCAGLSSIRFVPYLIATAAGLLPGTIAIVVLGDALTGRTDPALLVVSAVCVAIGLGGLIIDARLPTESPPLAGGVWASRNRTR